MKEIIAPTEGKNSTENKRRILIAIGIPLAITAIIVIIAILIIGNYWGTKNQESNQGTLNEEEKQELLASIKEHIMIFNTEEPLIVTINNAEELIQQQAFFQYSQDNDILLIYQDKALIYRPSEDVLVNVGPVYLTNQANTPAPQQISQTISLDIRNGSQIIGRAVVLGDELSSKDEYEVVNVGNAAKNSYQGNLLVNLTGKDISNLEKEFGIEAIDSLPEDEEDSQADVVAILGN